MSSLRKDEHININKKFCVCMLTSTIQSVISKLEDSNLSSPTRYHLGGVITESSIFKIALIGNSVVFDFQIGLEVFLLVRMQKN